MKNKLRVLQSLVFVSFVLFGCASPGQTGTAPAAGEATSPGQDYSQPGVPPAAPASTQPVVQQPTSPPATVMVSTAIPTVAPTQVVAPPEPTALPAMPAETQPVSPTETGLPPSNPTFTPAVPVTGSLDLLHLDNFLDYQVSDPAGGLIGEVDDLIVDLAAGETGQAPYLVVSSIVNDDFLIPVPWRHVQVLTDRLSVQLPVDGNQLLRAPAFNEDFWPASLSAEWKNMVDQFWQNPAQAAAPTAPQLPSTAGQPSGYIQADELLDLDIVDSRGIEIGDLTDAAIDWQNSLPGSGAEALRFSYVIVDRGDLLGLGAENIPVPWRLLRVNPLQETAQVSVQPQVLQNAPAYDDFTVPDLYKSPWAEQLTGYWQQVQ